MHEIEIIPTCVPQSLEDSVQIAERVSAFSPALHIDVNDGIFAMPQTWPHDLTQPTMLPPIETHVHAMVQDVTAYGAFFAHAGVHTLIVHGECMPSRDDIDTWKRAGITECGTAFLLGTPIEHVIEQIAVLRPDIVLLMSVATIGAQGAPFDERIYDRIRAVRAAYPDSVIAVDGGVSERNIIQLIESGATRLYVGAAIMRTDDPAASYAHLKALAKSAIQ